MASKVLREEKEKLKLVHDKCQVILNELLRDDDNKYCVDCDAKGEPWVIFSLLLSAHPYLVCQVGSEGCELRV